MENSNNKVIEIARELIIERCLAHGLPHIVDSKKSLWIRIFWGFLLFVSLGFYFYFLCLISFKFFINPDITFNYGFRPMRELPFPAITICSPTFSYFLNTNLEFFAESSYNFSNGYCDFVSNLQWCSMDGTIKALKLVKNRTEEDLFKFMKNSQLSLDEFLFNCSHNEKALDCKKLFTQTITDHGLCYTYNMAKDEDKNWNIDDGYNTESEDVKPHRASNNEISINLRIPTNQTDRTLAVCPNYGTSYHYFLHQPNELNLPENPYLFGFNVDRVIEISVKSVRIRKDIRNYRPDVRNCYLQSEKKLKYFKTYTEAKCKFECLTDHTFNNCNCVKFSMPRGNKTKICGNYEEVKCLFNIQSEWSGGKLSCDCPNTCSKLKYDKRSDIEHSLDPSSENSKISRIKFKICDLDAEEEVKLNLYGTFNYITGLAGLTSLFTGCSVVSILELVFFIIERRRKRGEETTKTESSLDEFVQSSSIEGAKSFHSSESKFVKIFWIFIFFSSFFGLGFYVFVIIKQTKVNPAIAEEIGQISMQEIPFPAITVCFPFISSNSQLNGFLGNPEMNFTFEQQNEMAANLESCSPQLASKYAQYLPMADSNLKISYLKTKNPFEGFQECFLSGGISIDCDKILNYVLTDYGFCFTFNLEGFSTLFNTEVISDDFKCYKRDKIVENILMNDFDKRINEDNQTINWTLEKGYLVTSNNVWPLTGKLINRLTLNMKPADKSNLCRERGSYFSFFFHMPNEILTPFHRPFHMNLGQTLHLNAKYYKANENLRPYPPVERGCYFDGEKSLKFFKSYTKAHCEFECLTNFTLDVCGCVKFSMPRENSTPICGINQTSCYVEAMRNWSSNCSCLRSCTYIEYGSDFELKAVVSALEFIPRNFFAEKFVKSSIYGLENGLADFGGMLGVFFGASVISFIEIFYFCFIALIKKKFNIQVESSEISTRISNIQVSSEIANESTVHGIQFIFKPSLHKTFRVFWIIIFILTLIFGLFYARGNYLKFAVYPESNLKKDQKSIEQIPFPAISICTPIFAKDNLTAYRSRFMQDYFANIKNITNDQFGYFIANLFWLMPQFVNDYLMYRVKGEKRNSWNYQHDIDFFDYFNRSHYEIDEYFLRCEIDDVEVECKKIFRRVMTINGMCYSFNMQSFHTIFNKEISKNFDSYGRFEEEEESQWSLDQGYKVKNPTYPINASPNKKVMIQTKIFHTSQGFYLDNVIRYFFIHSPSDIVTTTSKYNHFSYYSQKFLTFSASSIRADKSLRRFKPENRGCYFQNERKLQFFKTYTQSNCEFECFTNYTLETCGCVPYLLLHNKTTKMCNSADEAFCYSKSLENFPSLNDTSTPCGCLRTCNKIEYQHEEKETDMKYFFQYQELIKNNLISELNMRIGVSKFIEEEVFVSYEFINFITEVGGLLGLFLGCSMLSFFELIYYPTKFAVEKVKKKNQMRKNLVSLDVKVIQEINRDLTSKDENEKEGKETKENQETTQVSVEIEHSDTREGKIENPEVKNVEDKEENLELNEQEKEDKKINKTEEEKNSNEEKTEITHKVEEIETKKTKLAKKDSENQNPAKDEEVEKTESSLSMEEIEHQNFLKLLDEVEKEFSVIPGTLEGDNDSISTSKTLEI